MFSRMISGTNTQAERLFSIVKGMWTQERSELKLQRIAAMALIKYNTNQSCIEFYQSIKGNRSVLDAIRSGEKYKIAIIDGQGKKQPLQLDADSISCCEDDIE